MVHTVVCGEAVETRAHAPASFDKPDPTPAADDAFFQFARDAGLGRGSIIYSLHLFNEDPRHNPPPGTSNTVAAAHIWNTAADRAGRRRSAPPAPS